MSIQQKEKNHLASSASSLADSAKDTAGRAGDVVKEAASSAAQKASDVGAYAAQKASDAGSYISQKAGDATSAVGGEMKSFAGSIRDKGPRDGMLGNATSAVANTLESYGRELEEQGLSGITEDITNTVRRHPVPSVLIGIGLGFILARVFTK